MNKNNIYLIISWILVIVWMIIIFTFSSVNGKNSAKSSIGIISKTVELNSNVLYNTKLINKPLNKSKINKIAKNLNYPVRKGLHISEYSILALLLYNALRLSKAKKVYLLSFLISLLYSLSDEFHQLFTSRTSSIIDVLIDSIGIIGALLLIYIIKIKHEKNLKEIF